MSKKRKPLNVWVVIPGYNEEKYLKKVLSQVLRHTKKVIFVDDHSLDHSFAVAKKCIPHVLHHRVNLGKGAALRTGCEYAFRIMKADAVILMDADAQHDPDEIPLFLTQLKKGYPIVFGVREDTVNMPWIRNILNKCVSLVVAFFFGVYIPDIPSGYKAFTQSAYKKIRWTAMKYEVELEIACRVGKNALPFTTICIKTLYHDMNKGMTMLDGIYILTHLVNWKLSL